MEKYIGVDNEKYIGVDNEKYIGVYTQKELIARYVMESVQITSSLYDDNKEIWKRFRKFLKFLGSLENWKEISGESHGLPLGWQREIDRDQMFDYLNKFREISYSKRGNKMDGNDKLLMSIPFVLIALIVLSRRMS